MKIFLKKNENNELKYVSLYKPVQLDINGINIIINKEKKTKVLTYQNNYDQQLIIKLQDIISKTQGDFLEF